MAEASSTSFIPKNANKVRKPRTSKRIYIFSYISYVFFFGTLLAVLGVYVYSAQVKNELEAQKQQLASERSAFSEGDIAAVRDLEKRMTLAEQLLEESTAPSRIFNSIETVIADTIHLIDFKYERLANNDFILTFSAAADTFDAGIFQRELIRAVPVLAAAEISEYTYGESTTDESGTSDDLSALGVSERMVITFESAASSALIPYEPATATEEFEEELVAATTTVDTETGTSSTSSGESNE